MNAPTNNPLIPETEGWFRLLFERSADAIFLLDPQRQVFVECNNAALEMMGATDRRQILQCSPADLSPEFQPDGSRSDVKARALTDELLEHGTTRFEWRSRRFDGQEFPVEVSLTAIQPGDAPLVAVVCRDISERNARQEALQRREEQFRTMFERSADAMTLFDPETGLFVASNRASNLALGGATDAHIEGTSPASIAPEFQPDGRRSEEAIRDVIAQVLKNGSHRYEWALRRLDGAETRLENVTTAVQVGGKTLLLTVARNIEERKRMEADIRRLNTSLEQRIAERTSELRSREAQLRTLIDYAPEAIVVFDVETGQFLECNENACRLWGVDHDTLLTLFPWDVSPERQPDGTPSLDLARHYLQEVAAGRAPVFEWMHRHADGRLIPCEVRLVALPGNGRTRVRGSVIDNSERHRRELIQSATYDIAQAVLAGGDLDDFYRSIHQIIQRLLPAANFFIALHDPAAGLITFPYFADEHGGRPDPMPVEAGLTGHVFRTGKPLLVSSDAAVQGRSDAGGGEPPMPLKPPYQHRGRPAASWLGVPLLRGETSVGVMAVQDYGNPKAYGEPDQQLLTYVAAQVAIAIERRRAQDQLRKSEEKFKRLFEELPLGISQVAWDGRYLQVNAAFARILGCTREECLKLNSWDTTPPEYAAQEAVVFETVRRDGRFGPFEKECIRVDGRRVPIVVHSVLVRAPDGEEQVWGIVQDVTARKQAEQALRASEQSYRALFEASSQGVMINDEQAFLQLNDAAARIFGYRKEEIIGRPPSELAAPVQPDGEPSDRAAARHIADCMRDGQTRFEWVSRRADGADVPLDVVLTRIETGDRHVMQAMVTDISERKRAEAELKRALEHERELSQLKSNFVSMVSHEFRTPLGVIQSSAEILSDYLSQLTPEERLEQLKSIIKNSRRMAGLMEEVLVLGRLDAGRMSFQPALLDLAALCRQLVDEVHSTTEAQCPIEFFTAGLPTEAMADERLLRHILLNLLSNAVKYSDPGERVVFHARGSGDAVEFIVSDRGIGIPQPEQERLFEAFHRGSNVGQRQGTGLGLVIVKRCVDLHRGTIAIESRVGRGTSVTVALPLQVERNLS